MEMPKCHKHPEKPAIFLCEQCGYLCSMQEHTELSHTIHHISENTVNLWNAVNKEMRIHAVLKDMTNAKPEFITVLESIQCALSNLLDSSNEDLTEACKNCATNSNIFYDATAKIEQDEAELNSYVRNISKELDELLEYVKLYFKRQ